LIHVRHGYKPKNSLQEIDPAGKPHMVPVSSHAQAIPGLMVYRFHHGMYYANAERLSQEVLDLINTAEPPLSWFCIDATAVDDIDFSAAANLRETYRVMKEKGVRLVLAELEDDIRLELDRSEVTDVIGKDFIFETVADVEAAYRATVQGNKT